MRFPLLTSLVLLALCVGASHAAPPQPRPYSGTGVLALRPAPEAEQSLIPIYVEPGLQRITELKVSGLPRLAGDPQAPLVAVSATRGGWLRLAYDDAGREGWIESARNWNYLLWAEYLPRRVVRVLPGMKKGLYVLRGEPRDGSPERGSLSRDQQVQVVQVVDDWARLQSPAGWFRWRDGDGRLTVAP
jgi:hypothetical protein